LLILVVFTVLAVLARWPENQAVLVVRDENTGRKLEIGSISEGGTFELRFMHSVDRLPVHDIFVYRDGGLVLEQTRCLSFGAGLGYFGQGELKGENGWNVIVNMNRKVGNLPLRVGTVADHTIVYRGEEYHLDRYFPPRSLVLIGVEKNGLIKGGK